MAQSRFGVFGLAVMGQNLARNIAHHGIPISVYNRTRARTDEFMGRYSQEGDFKAAGTPQELVAEIAPPRPILMMVKAGAPVDEAIAELRPHLQQGDILIDGGNSLFTDTERRATELEAAGLRFLGAGISGGEEGALNGPSIMPGGTRQAYDLVAPVLTSIAAHVNGEPCCTYVGPGGAGHYVKMVHNGIEYADMQLITESYDLLRRLLRLEPPALAGVFRDWNSGDLESFLIQITAEVLSQADPSGEGALVDHILDEAEQKGTGRWAVISALELGVPVTAITEAVFARVLSSLRDQRLAAADVLAGPEPVARPGPEFVEQVRDALYASKIVAYAQGFEQLAAASREHGWDLDLGSLARIWRGGCIIRARFLDRIVDAYAGRRDPDNLLVADYFQEAVSRCQAGWRSVVALAAGSGVATPAFSASLAYYDGYRNPHAPANLIQGLRDYFGAHTYRRTDRPGSFHTRWAQDGQEVTASGS